jgi:hypothetical protein
VVLLKLANEYEGYCENCGEYDNLIEAEGGILVGDKLCYDCLKEYDYETWKENQ